MSGIRKETDANADEPRLPQIDPITFSALSMLDGFLGRAALTRHEHAEANRSLQHIVQTIEILQATVKELQRQSGKLQKTGNVENINSLGKSISQPGQSTAGERF